MPRRAPSARMVAAMLPSPANVTAAPATRTTPMAPPRVWASLRCARSTSAAGSAAGSSGIAEPRRHGLQGRATGQRAVAEAVAQHAGQDTAAVGVAARGAVDVAALGL